MLALAPRPCASLWSNEFGRSRRRSGPGGRLPRPIELVRFQWFEHSEYNLGMAGARTLSEHVERAAERTSILTPDIAELVVHARIDLTRRWRACDAPEAAHDVGGATPKPGRAPY